MAIPAASSRAAEGGGRNPTANPPNEEGQSKLGRAYHQDRTHIGLNKNTPTERAVESHHHFQTRIVSTSRLGGFPIITGGRKQREPRANILLMSHNRRDRYK